MKTIKHLPLFIFIIFILSSCSLWRLSNRNMMSIERGMTKTEIKRMLGNPDYRNFDREGEEWVYTTTEKNLIVGFYNDIVESMTTFPTGTYYGRNSYPEMSNSSYPAYPENNPNMGNSPAVMSDKEFQDLYTTANRQPLREDKMTSIRNGVYGRAFTCRQCVRMMSLFTFDDEKLQVFNIMAPNILDWENQHLILDNFKFVSSRDKAMQTIQSIRKR